MLGWKPINNRYFVGWAKWIIVIVDYSYKINFDHLTHLLRSAPLTSFTKGGIVFIVYKVTKLDIPSLLFDPHQRLNGASRRRQRE